VDYEKGLKNGVPDLARTMLSFHAFVSRCMTHGGVNTDFIEETMLYLKEFMSSLFEFDVLVRFRSPNVSANLNEEEDRMARRGEKKMNVKKGSRKEKKVGEKLEAWWLKSNFMSLLNLIPMMEELGPLILWWDGGGKGERFIQQIKPHIKKGVREDAPNFFVGLMEKMYRLRVIELLEERYGFNTEVVGKGDVEETQTLNDALMAAQVEEAAHAKEIDLRTSPEEDYSEGEEQESSDTDDRESYQVSDEDLEEEEVKEELYQFTRAEEEGMLKQSTIYVYRSVEILHSSVQLVKPLAGFLKYENGLPVFYCAYRVPGKQFGTVRIVFDDNIGMHFFGLWYARIVVEGDYSNTTDSFKEIQDSAKTAAVAIPLHYIFGSDKPESNLYCVITNWWKHRFKGGDYKLPILDNIFYGATPILFREDLMAAEHPENVI
jgi:hypothetical protein